MFHRSLLPVGLLGLASLTGLAGCRTSPTRSAEPPLTSTRGRRPERPDHLVGTGGFAWVGRLGRDGAAQVVPAFRSDE